MTRGRSNAPPKLRTRWRTLPIPAPRRPSTVPLSSTVSSQVEGHASSDRRIRPPRPAGKPCRNAPLTSSSAMRLKWLRITSGIRLEVVMLLIVTLRGMSRSTIILMHRWRKRWALSASTVRQSKLRAAADEDSVDDRVVSPWRGGRYLLGLRRGRTVEIHSAATMCFGLPFFSQPHRMTRSRKIRLISYKLARHGAAAANLD